MQEANECDLPYLSCVLSLHEIFIFRLLDDVLKEIVSVVLKHSAKVDSIHNVESVFVQVEELLEILHSVNRHLEQGVKEEDD